MKKADSSRVRMVPNHLALLVRSADQAAARLRDCGFSIGPAEEWEGEGTREIYVGREKGHSLLLMEPVKAGAYLRAMQKRGPGLHHFAIDVLDMEAFLTAIASSGWLLHPRSVQTLAQSRTVYLARPGFPALVEVQERKALDDLPLFVNQVGLASSDGLSGLAAAVGLKELLRFDAQEAWIQCEARRFTVASLCAGES